MEHEMDHTDIEKKWQQKWLDAKLGRVDTADKSKPVFFMHFAYPTVSGYQHVGHMRGYSYTDMICRYKKMRGYNVFFPVGSHASGNPMLAFSKKIERGDEKRINYLLENGYPEEKLDDMKDPMKAVDYFNEDYKKNWRIMGFIPDLESFTCTVYPDYEKFIEWQFKKLKDKGLLIQQPYFSTFCPSCGPVAVDPAEMDISKGGHAEKHEYTIIKFGFENEGRKEQIIAATLRPETMYGQTNLWVDTEQEYVVVKVGDESWVCSPQCAEKLKYQKDNVEVTGKITGREMIGKYAHAPAVERNIIILPSKFCDPNIGTGIVTSVPSDAPYDWMGLKDLAENEEEMKKYELNPEEIRAIKVIPIIKSKDMGDTPAVKICEEMQIKDQNDPKLEEATKTIYKTGFHTGVMNENCGPYAGKPVEQAKEKVKEKLINENKADTMYDLSEEVICRCGEHVIIKKVPDQWFINYADHMLTQESKKHAEVMNITPPDYKENMPGILDWFKERAAARLGNWLGTTFPFDTKWTIEPIADSTLYPAYYVVSRYFNRGAITVEEMTEEFFDYVFLDQGSPKNDTWKQIRDDFDYLYPVDINLGGKEHMTVHFPVYIMNHAALLREKDWPKGIFAHWWIVEKGGKISKSKGGAATIPAEAVKMYSADALRLYYAHIASPYVDVEWDEKTARSYKAHVGSLFSMINQIKELELSDETKSIDKWILSRLNSKYKQYLKCMDKNELRKAVGAMIFDLTKDVRRYLKRGGNNSTTLKKVLGTWLKSLTPFTPHTCEECWSMLGHEDLVSAETLPEVDEEAISKEAEQAEEIVQTLESDIQNVLKIARIKPKKTTVFIAPDWKRNAWNKVRKMESPKTVVQELMKSEEMKTHSQNALRYAQWLKKHFRDLSDIISTDEELNGVKESSDYISNIFNSEIVVIKADESDHPKSANAIPGKPAIFIE